MNPPSKAPPAHVNMRSPPQPSASRITHSGRFLRGFFAGPSSSYSSSRLEFFLEGFRGAGSSRSSGSSSRSGARFEDFADFFGGSSPASSSRLSASFFGGFGAFSSAGGGAFSTGAGAGLGL